MIPTKLREQLMMIILIILAALAFWFYKTQDVSTIQVPFLVGMAALSLLLLDRLFSMMKEGKVDTFELYHIIKKADNPRSFYFVAGTQIVIFGGLFVMMLFLLVTG